MARADLALLVAICLAAVPAPTAAVRMAPRPQTPAAPQQTLLSKAETARVRAYNDGIVEAVKRLPQRVSLVALIEPLMALAETRSAGGKATDENRAAILALAVYVNGRKLAVLIPESRTWPRPEGRALTLHSRGDLAQHFTMSAAIGATAGAPIADLIGLAKELDDARRGSGFSFADLAADRAGTTFGLRATETEPKARGLQAKIETGFAESQMMPEVTGLPENMSEVDFTQRYRGIRSPEYTRMLDEIERRIAALPIFQR